MEISYHNCGQLAPEGERRTSANDINNLLHGEKMWPYYWDPYIKCNVIWNSEIVIFWRI